MIPTICNLPDLSDIQATRLSGWNMVYSFVPEKISGRERAYRAIFCRLVDKALSEYAGARSAILAAIAEAKRPPKEMARTGRILYTGVFTDHMEDCIGAIHRAATVLDRIKSEPLGAELPKITRKLIETYSQEIADVRNVIEHMDEEIRGDKLAGGTPIMISVGPDQDSAVIGGNRIAFDRLATLLRNLHKLGLDLFDKTFQSPGAESV